MSDASNPMSPPPAPRRPRARRTFLLTAAVLAVLVTAGSGFAIAAIKHFDRELTTSALQTGPRCTGSSCLRHVDTFCVRQACNFLVLGSDSRAGLSKQQQAQYGSEQNSPGQRSDTMIVVQVDPENNRTIVLSIPRDLRVSIPGHGVDKINTAFMYGPDVVVQTVEKLTGLHINHYVEVNFEGFQELVDALGGVPVCVPKPMIDVLAGLRLPKKGCYNLKGPEALAFVRARHVQGDLIPDFSRITRQQQFIRALITKALSVGAVLKIPQFVAAAKKNMVIDRGLNIYDLQQLTSRLAKLGQQNVFFRIVPARPVQIAGEDFVQLTEPAASKLFERIRKGMGLGSIGEEAEATAVSPASVTVQVEDAGSNGQAAAAVAYLQKAGFVVPAVVAAPSGATKSALYWGHGAGNQERVVSSYLTTLPVFYDNAKTKGSTITVVIGPDFKGVG